DRSFEGSLLWAIDKTQTGMGSRMLRKWLLEPLDSVSAIKERQEAVAELLEDADRRRVINEALSNLSDLERLAVKLSSATANPKDLVAVKCSLENLPAVSDSLRGTSSPHLTSLIKLPPELETLRRIISEAIVDDPPREITEGGIMTAG